MIDEEIDFNNAVDSVISWIEKNSSWDETLLIVTGDHETGYLTGPNANDNNPNTNPVVNNGVGIIPGMAFNSTDHTNSLIPIFAKGVGSEIMNSFADHEDYIRGRYMNNSEVALTMMNAINQTDHLANQIMVSSLSIDENEGANASVGTIQTNDFDMNENYTYTLVDAFGMNSDDNAKFTITNETLKISENCDFEMKKVYNITVKADDGKGNSLTNQLMILVNDINEEPVDLTINPSFVKEEAAINEMVADFMVEDPDMNEEFSMSLVSGNGTNDADNSMFEISNNSLKLTSALSYNDKPVLHINVKVEDNGGNELTKAFAIPVIKAGLLNIEELEKAGYVVYPNPSNGIFNIEATSENNNSLVEIRNMNGSLVMSKLLKSSSERFDISQFGKGAYILKITKDERSYNSLIITK